MRLHEYQGLVERTRNFNENEIANYALGLTGEAGEVGDLIKKHYFHGHTLDKAELKKELGDVLWYLANIANVAGISLEQIAYMNLAKLNKRYPNGFSQDNSINREL